MAPLFFRKSMILMDFFCAFYKSMILIWLRVGGGNCGSRRFGAKPVQAALLGRALRQPDPGTAGSAYHPNPRKIGANCGPRCYHPNSRKIGANWGPRCCAPCKAHGFHMRKVRTDKFRACSILPQE